jgi:hypothetical protein
VCMRAILAPRNFHGLLPAPRMLVPWLILCQRTCVLRKGSHDCQRGRRLAATCLTPAQGDANEQKRCRSAPMSSYSAA